MEQNYVTVTPCIHCAPIVKLLLLLCPLNGLFSRTTWVSRYQKGKTSLDLYETGDDGVSEAVASAGPYMQTICTSLQTDNNTNTHQSVFYRPDALPAAKPTAPKHSIIIKVKPIFESG